MWRQADGFTLLEMLLSVALISILAALSLPLYQSFQNRNNLDTTTQTVAELVRRAEVYARGNNTDNQWGVEVQSTAVTLFQGTTFSTRTTTYDETVSLPSNVTIAGLSEILFSKLSGAPNTTGTITLTNTINNDVRTISINAKGVVSY